MAAAAAAVTLGISVELVVTAISALGISVIGAVLTGQAIEKIKEWIRTREIDTYISDHVMTQKHKFNDKCGHDCIIEVARKLKVHSSWLADNGIPIIRGSEYCRHGCEIEVRLSIPLFQKDWKIGTAFHKGSCKAM